MTESIAIDAARARSAPLGRRGLALSFDASILGCGGLIALVPALFVLGFACGFTGACKGSADVARIAGLVVGQLQMVGWIAVLASVLADHDRGGIHDRVAGTVMVDDPSR